MLPSQILLSLLLPTAALAKNIDNGPGFYALKFNVSRGSSYESSTAGASARLKVRDAPEGTILTEIENESTFYSVDLKIGSTEQEVVVLVDTGSSDLWVTDSTNPYCSSSSSSSSSSSKKFRNLDDAAFYNNLVGGSTDDPVNKVSIVTSFLNKASSTSSSSTSQSIDCSTYGTFDHSESTTFHDNGTEFYILYGDSTFAYGTWGYDNVVVGGISVDDLSFAVANQTNSTVSVLGIGLQGLETTYSGSLASSIGAYQYSNLPVKMVEDGLINKRVYSLYLNDVDATSGNVLFGGVDHAKYTGTLTTVPVINTLKSSGYNTAIKLEITLSGISFDGTSVYDDSTSALLDSGTTLTYIPSTIISSIASSVGAEYSSSYGYYLMDCPSSEEGAKNLTFEFDGVSIPVPLSNFILAADSIGTTCVLALMDSGDDTAILGDSLLRSAYVVYDLDNLEIGMAPVKFTTDENIEVVTDSIPSASQASDYSSTASVDSSDSTALLGSLGDDDSSSDGTTSTSSTGSTSTPTSDDNDDDSSSSTSSRSTSTASSSSNSASSSSGASSLNMPLAAIIASLTFGLLAAC